MVLLLLVVRRLDEATNNSALISRIANELEFTLIAMMILVAATIERATAITINAHFKKDELGQCCWR